MKKILGIITLAAVFMTSCQTISKTAHTAEVTGSLKNATVADLEVSDRRITYTMTPKKSVQRAGFENVKRAVEAEALEANGKADVLVEPQYVIEKKRSLFGSKITSITVSGRPAYYTNFRSLPDSVWSNPVFRGAKVVYVSNGGEAKTGGGLLGGNLFGKLFKRGATGATDAYRKKGFEKHVNLGFASGEFNIDGDKIGDSELYTSLLTSFGYRFNPYFYLGAGVGIMYSKEYDDDPLIPLYVNFRFNLNKKKISPFIDYKLGYSFFTTDDYDIRGGVYDDGGLFIGSTIGVNIGKWEVGMEVTSTEYKLESGYRADADEKVLLTYGLSIGYSF